MESGLGWDRSRRRAIVSSGRRWNICSRGEVASPTAYVSQALRFLQIGLLPPQLLGQQLLLCNVDGSTVKRFKDSTFRNWNTHAANVP